MDEVIFFASHAPVRSTRRRFPTPWSSRARVTRVSRWVFDEGLGVEVIYRYFSPSSSYSVRAMSASLALSAAAMISVGSMESSSAASSE